MEIVNHYVLERVIGEGGFSRVYQAVDSRLNCKVALKQYNNPDILEKEVSFYNELAGIAGILSVRDRFVENGQAFLVMDFVDGMTLEQFISQKNGRLSEQEAAEIIRQVLIVLNQIHSRGYIHCDLGTDNILLDRQGNVKIIDFTSMKSDMQKNNPEEVQLKNGFSAYEQYITDGTMGMYTDIYAVGAVLYRMLTGFIPPSAMQMAQNPDLIRQSNLGPVMSERIEFIVKMCLETEPQKRFQTVAASYNALFNENINEALYEPARIWMQPQTQNPQVQNPQSPSGQALQQPENRKDIKTFTSAPVQPQRNDMVTVNPGSSMNVEGNTKKKKSKKKAVVLSICAIFLVVAVIVTGLIVSNIRKENESDDTSQEAMDKKQDDYEQAMQLCNQSNYDDAVKIFEELGDYSDSLSNLNKIADKYMEHSMTDKARDIYEYLSDYDSQDVEDDLKECDFVDAYDKYNDGEYADAKKEFDKLKDYTGQKQKKSAKEMAEECVYQMACEDLNNNEYSNFEEDKKIFENNKDDASIARMADKYKDGAYYQEAMDIYLELQKKNGTDYGSRIRECQTLLLEQQKYEFYDSDASKVYDSSLGTYLNHMSAQDAESELSRMYGTYYKEDGTELTIAKATINNKNYGIENMTVGSSNGYGITGTIYYQGEESNMFVFEYTPDYKYSYTENENTFERTVNKINLNGENYYSWVPEKKN